MPRLERKNAEDEKEEIRSYQKIEGKEGRIDRIPRAGIPRMKQKCETWMARVYLSHNDVKSNTEVETKELHKCNDR